MIGSPLLPAILGLQRIVITHAQNRCELVIGATRDGEASTARTKQTSAIIAPS
jgi:hypothetical protein